MPRSAPERMSRECSTDDSLSKHQLGSFKEIITLSLPMTLMLLSGALMTFCDRLFLLHYSLETLEACVGASFLCFFFQATLIFGAKATQVFVGECLGSKHSAEIGGYVWQMIWISLFSMAFILPLGRIAETLFFQSTSIREAGTVYFRCLIYFNFLFPLASALACFYCGRGKVWTVLKMTLVANLVNLGLDPLLIFGAKMGILGAALATGISQAVLCALMLADFLQKKHRDLFNTANFYYDKKKFWESVKVGFPQLMTRAVVIGSWVANVRLMTLKGGSHLVAFSVGSSISLLFLFFNEGIAYGMLSVASYAFGKKDAIAIKRLIRSWILSLLLLTCIAAFPCVLLPRHLIRFLFPKLATPEHIDILVSTCRFLLLFLVCQGLTSCFMFLLAKKDMLFTMCYNLVFTWIFQYVPVRVAMNVLDWSGDKFYLILAFGNLASATVYFLRFKRISRPTLDQTLQES